MLERLDPGEDGIDAEPVGEPLRRIAGHEVEAVADQNNQAQDQQVCLESAGNASDVEQGQRRQDGDELAAELAPGIWAYDRLGNAVRCAAQRLTQSQHP
jgi:hypothetical protein